MIWMTENTDSHSEPFEKVPCGQIFAFFLPSQPMALSHIKWESGEPANVARWPWQHGIITASRSATVYSLWSGKRRAFIWAVTFQKPTSVQRPWISHRQHAAHSVSSESVNHSSDSHLSGSWHWFCTNSSLLNDPNLLSQPQDIQNNLAIIP